MKQTFIRITAAAAFAGLALAAGGAAWAHAGAGCMGQQAATPPSADAQQRGPQGQGMRGMGMMGSQTAMAERMARMHGDGAATPGQPGAMMSGQPGAMMSGQRGGMRSGQPGGAMPCRDGATPACPFQEEHKH